MEDIQENEAADIRFMTVVTTIVQGYDTWPAACRHHFGSSFQRFSTQHLPNTARAHVQTPEGSSNKWALKTQRFQRRRPVPRKPGPGTWGFGPLGSLLFFGRMESNRIGAQALPCASGQAEFSVWRSVTNSWRCPKPLAKRGARRRDSARGKARGHGQGAPRRLRCNCLQKQEMGGRHGDWYLEAMVYYGLV